MQYVGEFTLGVEEKTFYKLNPYETNIDYSNCDKFEEINYIDNGPKYSRYINPYEKMVNLALIDSEDKNKFSFKSKAFYEKAVDLSQQPKLALMDRYNPIFNFIANPKEYKYYNSYSKK